MLDGALTICDDGDNGVNCIKSFDSLTVARVLYLRLKTTPEEHIKPKTSYAKDKNR